MTKTFTLPTKLEDAIKNNSLVIFVGAGCSMPLGMPSWKTLVEDILQDLHNKYGETSDTHFQNILNGVKANTKTLFDALNKIENDPDNGGIFKIKTQEFINSQIEEITKKLPEESKVHSLLWEISSKIITTNYDKILEKYKPKGINPKLFYNTNEFQSLKSHAPDSQFLYKIHGDYEDPKTIILFESDYREIYNNNNHNNDTLSSYFKEKTLLFIGFSLTDPFVNDLFTKIKSIYNGYTINEHFVFTTKSEDFIKYDVTAIKIDNWKDDLLNYLTELKKIKSDVNQKENTLTITVEKVDDKELTKGDISNIVTLITKKTTDLVNDPSNADLIKEVKDLRSKLDNLLFGKMDYLREVDEPFRHSDLSSLFETIYSSEKLNRQTLEQIQNIRNNNDKYKWYDRSVIVSAICCSLIHFNKADEQKITLIIDFINDNEEKVWQKAITSLFISLNHLGNKWLRFNSIKNKIASLNQNLRIQNACSTIIKVFNVGLNNISMINEELFENPYFNESPFNYFFPYHEEKNPAFELVYETYEGDDIDSFISFLNKVPIPDQVKYLICGDTSRKDDDQADQDEDEEKNHLSNLNHILKYNSFLFPYSIYVQEIISFYRFYPKYKHEEKLKSQLKLTETPLKDYLLNQKEKYSALGSHFMREKTWSQAIVNFIEAIKLDENDISNLLNLANCYKNNKEKDKEFALRIKIKNIVPENENNLTKLFLLCYNDKKDFNSCLQIANELLIINESEKYYNYRGMSFNKLGNRKQAIEDLTKSINLNSDEEEDTYHYNRSLIYYDEGEYEKSINDVNNAIKINKKSDEFIFHRATNYLALALYDEALKDIKLAESLSKDKGETYNAYSNYYRIIGNFDKAFEYIEKAEKIDKQAGFTGTRATIYGSKGDTINFYKYLEIALNDGGDINSLYPDVKDKFKNEPEFKSLITKYNQKII